MGQELQASHKYVLTELHTTYDPKWPPKSELAGQ